MGGKKYTKDGKKIPPKDEKTANQPSVGDQKTASGIQQRLPPEKSLSIPMQQMVVSEPSTSTSAVQLKQPKPAKQQKGAAVVEQRSQQPQAWGAQPQQLPVGQKQQRPSKPPAQGTSQQQRATQDRGPSSSKGQSSTELKSDRNVGSSLRKFKEDGVKYPPVVVPFLGKGTKGKRIGPIRTNYMKLMVGKTMVEFAYMYDVEITSKGPKKLHTRAFRQFLPPDVVYDGKKIAYSPRELKMSGELVGEVSVIHPETKKNWDYTLVIKPAETEPIPIRAILTKGNINPIRVQDAMQALDIILKSAFHQHLDKGIQGGRSFFFRPNPADEQRFYLKDFCNLRLGLFQSMVLGEVPLLNVDVCHKAFPKRYASLIHLLQDMEADLSTRNRRFQIDLNKPLEQIVREKLVAHLKGLEICYNRDANDKKIYKFYELGNVPAKEMFTLTRNDKQEVKSVLQYFKEINRQIQFENLQTIRLGRRENFISVPMEFCSISDDQVINKKCTDNQTREMIRHAAGSTNDREDKIMDLIRRVCHNESPAINEFGMRIDTKFIDVPARQLPPPKIEYKGNKCINVTNGSWNMTNDTQFLVSPNSAKFAIINADRYTNENLLYDFVRQLKRNSGQVGLEMEQISNPIRAVLYERDLREQLDDLGKQADIVFCVLGAYRDAITYATIKQLAELDFGVLTSCIKAKTMEGRNREGMDRSTMGNILKKVNAKLNGTNHKLNDAAILKDYDKGKVMFMGADVTHPPPGLNEDQRYSVVGVAASYDRNGFQYNTAWHLQHGEIISDFRRIVREHLEKFKMENRGTLPQKIIYYRDGVSDSQFDEVMAREKVAITEACNDAQKGNEKIDIKLTVIIVQKRHHTRLFPPRDKRINERDRFNNVPPGTVVDTTIIRPNESHFFLCSHQSIQGVARPTKYCVLFDDNQMTADDLQELTNNLCHLYSRCDRAVSYPAPTYYAHLLAARRKVYLENKFIDNEDLENEFRKVVVHRNMSKYSMNFV